MRVTIKHATRIDYSEDVLEGVMDSEGSFPPPPLFPEPPPQARDRQSNDRDMSQRGTDMAEPFVRFSTFSGDSLRGTPHTGPPPETFRALGGSPSCQSPREYSAYVR